MTGCQVRTHRTHDEGFTLVEMVISFLILGIIIAPLVSAYVLGLGTATSTAQAVANSSDAELVAGYFSTDVASATTVSPSDQSGGNCGGSATILQIQSVDLSSTSAPTVYVSYELIENTSAEGDLFKSANTVYELERVTCDATGTPTSTQILAETLQVTPSPLPSIGALTSPQPLCDGAACAVGSKPQTVSLTLTEYEYEKLTPPTPTVSYTFTVNGERRVNS